MSGENPNPSGAELLMRRTLEAKAKNPLFAKYLELWNERASQIVMARTKQRILEQLTSEMDEIWNKLSPEERQLL